MEFTVDVTARDVINNMSKEEEKQLRDYFTSNSNTGYLASLTCGLSDYQMLTNRFFLERFAYFMKYECSEELEFFLEELKN